MASPQVDNGYTRIANELLEALARTRIPGEARQLFDVIMRKTYGYGKKEDEISTSQFIKAAGLNRGTVYKARRKLKEMNIITISKKGDSQMLTYSLQKNYEHWRLSPKKETVSKKVNRYLPKRTKTVSQFAPHNINKENIQNKADEFFTYYLLKTQKDFKLTEDKRKLIENRLAEGYTLEQLKLAVDSFIQDPWPERKKHLNLIYCIGKQCGKPDNLEKWLNFNQSNRPNVKYD